MTPVAEVRTPSPGFSALMDQATRSSKHVMLGEPHRDNMTARTYGLMADNPEAFQSAARNGVKHLVIELPAEMQGDVNAFMSGSISREEFKDRLKGLDFGSAQGDAADVARQEEVITENMTRTFENARDSGMKVHFVDTSADSSFSSPVPDSVLSRSMEWTREYAALHPDDEAKIAAKDPEAIGRLADFITAKVEALPEGERAQMGRDMSDRTFRDQVSRAEADLEIYGLIRERIPPGEGMIGVFGAHHLDNNNDFRAERSILGIDDLLEEEGASVSTIELESNESRDHMRRTNTENGLVPLDPPDYKINLDEGSIVDRGNNPVGTLEGGLTPARQPPAAPVADAQYKAQAFQ